MNVLIVASVLTMSMVACKGQTGYQGDKGNTGSTGQQGIQGGTGLTGATGSTGVQGPSGIQGLTGAPGAVGPAGTPGTIVTPVQFCPGTESYPSTFPEYGLCINGVIYAVYSANDGFLTAVANGQYYSNAIGSSCDFTVTGCNISY